jgi:hypothetical protein
VISVPACVVAPLYCRCLFRGSSLSAVNVTFVDQFADLPDQFVAPNLNLFKEWPKFIPLSTEVRQRRPVARRWLASVND